MAPARARIIEPDETANSGEDPQFRMPPFSRSLPMLLSWAREAVMKRFRASLQSHGFSEQQWRIVRALSEAGSLDIVALSERCCILPASLSRILPKLSADGLITRGSDTADQRCVIVSLTAEGRRRCESAVEDFEPIYAQMTRDIGAERAAQVNLVLEDLIDRLAADKPARRDKAKRQRAP